MLFARAIRSQCITFTPSHSLQRPAQLTAFSKIRERIYLAFQLEQQYKMSDIKKVLTDKAAPRTYILGHQLKDFGYNLTYRTQLIRSFHSCWTLRMFLLQPHISLNYCHPKISMHRIEPNTDALSVNFRPKQSIPAISSLSPARFPPRQTERLSKGTSRTKRRRAVKLWRPY